MKCKQLSSPQRSVLLLSFVQGRLRDGHLAAESEMVEYVRRVSRLVYQFPEVFDAFRTHFLIEGDSNQLRTNTQVVRPLHFYESSRCVSKDYNRGHLKFAHSPGFTITRAALT